MGDSLVRAHSTSPVAPGDVGPGPATYSVGRRSVNVTVAPGRVLDADIWYPAAAADVTGVEKSVYEFPGITYPSTVAFASPPVSSDGPFPLVVYSHGSGGLRYISAFLTEALAARGFVVISVDHTGNTAIDEFSGSTLTPQQVLPLRPEDIRAEIDFMAAANANAASPFSGAVDTDNVGLVGHSAGGTGVLMTVSGSNGTAGDKRVKGVVGLAAYTEPISDSELKNIKIPTMLISGTLDTTTPIKAQTTRAWKFIPGDPGYRVDLKGAGHQSFSDVCYYEELVDAKPELAPSLVEAVKSRTDEACTPKFFNINTAHKLIDRYAIGFMERYVAGEKAAAKWLKPVPGKTVTVTVKN